MGLRHDAWFAEGEQARFEAQCLQFTTRHSYQESPLEAVAEHRALACRWWRRGVGILVHGEDFQPAQRLIEEP